MVVPKWQTQPYIPPPSQELSLGQTHVDNQNKNIRDGRDDQMV